MPQNALKLTARQRKGGGRKVQKKASKMRKGTLARKPKKQSLAAANNKQKKMTAAIARNIERTTGKQLSQNGGDLSLLKRISQAAKSGGDEVSKTATAPKFNTRKQFRLTS